MNTIPLRYGEDRWTIIYGKYEGTSAVAADRVYNSTMPYFKYVLTVESHDKFNCANIKDFNIIFIGTPNDNMFIDMLVKEGKVKLPNTEQGYSITICDNSENDQKQFIVITANSDKGLLNGCVDFCGKVLIKNLPTHTHNNYFKNPFVERFINESIVSDPSIDKRSIWTWGHVIYDFKSFIDNMVTLKLNSLIIWNDFVPVNMKQTVDYAHLNGIEVVFGFSWGWGVDLNLSDNENIEYWCERVIKKYEEEYLNLNGDGVYFQTFTETNESIKDGEVISAKATEWVNIISKKILEKYPNLHIQFGLHATSVKNELEYLKNVNKNVHIIWEDCGSFPYNYIPTQVQGYKETMELSEKIAVLRGQDDKFGVVLKGFTALDWTTFEHQQGHFIQGGASKRFKNARTSDKEKVLRFIQAYWMKNLKLYYDYIRKMVEIKGANVYMQALIEDGMFEEKVWYPIALYSEILWDCSVAMEEIVCVTAMNPDIAFASE